MRSRIGFILLALLSTSAGAADQCTGLAVFAATVAEYKAAGIPQTKVADMLRANYLEDTEAQRNDNVLTERVLAATYRLDAKPQEVRMNIFLRCKAGEFDAGKRK